MVLQFKRKRIAVPAVAAATLVLAAACGSSGGSSKANSAQPYAGQTLTIEAYAAVPEFDFYKSQMRDFTKKTGIKVNWVSLPVATMDQKIPLQLKAKDTGLDVFFTGSEKITDFVGSGGVESLDTYMNDTAQTPASYNFTDIAPDVESACQSGGKTYCIATHTGGALLYYNTKMFSAAGITAPPQTPDELLQDAQKLTTKDHAGFCVRGDKSQALYDGFQLWNWFVPWNNPVTGTYFDKNWNFLLGTEPQASQFGNFYRTLLKNIRAQGHLDLPRHQLPAGLPAGPRGDVAGRLRHHPLGARPEPVEGRERHGLLGHAVPAGQPGPLRARAAVRHLDEQGLEPQERGLAAHPVHHLTSRPQVAATKAKALLTPSRNSVLKDPATVAVLPKTFPEALTYILAHPDVALLPFIPEGVAIIPPISNGLSDLITSNKSVAVVMATMKGGVDTIMKQAGYPKPFPSS